MGEGGRAAERGCAMMVHAGVFVRVHEFKFVIEYFNIFLFPTQILYSIFEP